MTWSDNTNHDHLEDNIKKLLSGTEPELSMPPASKERILSKLTGRRDAAVLDSPERSLTRRLIEMAKKPSVLSGLGVAAAVALVVTLLIPSNGGPAVQAATIVQKLDEQMAQDPLFEVTLDALTAGNVVINGWLQISQQEVVGDIVLTAAGAVEADFAMALSDSGMWILVRRLKAFDPHTQEILDTFFPAEGETLLLLPDDMVLQSHVGLDINAELSELRSGKVIHMLSELIDSPADFGATVEGQEDGTVLLTLPIENTEVIAALEGLVRSLRPSAQHKSYNLITITDSTMEVVREYQEGVTVERVDLTDGVALQQLAEKLQGAGGNWNIAIVGSPLDIPGQFETRADSIHVQMMNGAEVPADDDDESIGSTLTIVYDPSADVVRSFKITDLGPIKGTMSVTIKAGELDPLLLDPGRLTTPQTHTLDLGGVESLLEEIESAAP
ncbi:MAG: hypothetical protein JSU86_17795 [Phycisphaerales bacterium]|nr:MAG: hypothetical protein JSU86_17795 [Phycisphaerales bacterium]